MLMKGGNTSQTVTQALTELVSMITLFLSELQMIKYIRTINEAYPYLLYNIKWVQVVEGMPGGLKKC